MQEKKRELSIQRKCRIIYVHLNLINLKGISSALMSPPDLLLSYNMLKNRETKSYSQMSQKELEQVEDNIF